MRAKSCHLMVRSTVNTIILQHAVPRVQFKNCITIMGDPWHALPCMHLFERIVPRLYTIQKLFLKYLQKINQDKILKFEKRLARHFFICWATKWTPYDNAFSPALARQIGCHHGLKYKCIQVSGWLHIFSSCWKLNFVTFQANLYLTHKPIQAHRTLYDLPPIQFF